MHSAVPALQVHLNKVCQWLIQYQHQHIPLTTQWKSHIQNGQVCLVESHKQENGKHSKTINLAFSSRYPAQQMHVNIVCQMGIEYQHQHFQLTKQLEHKDYGLNVTFISIFLFQVYVTEHAVITPYLTAETGAHIE